MCARARACISGNNRQAQLGALKWMSEDNLGGRTCCVMRGQGKIQRKSPDLILAPYSAGLELGFLLLFETEFACAALSGPELPVDHVGLKLKMGLPLPPRA